MPYLASGARILIMLCSFCVHFQVASAQELALSMGSRTVALKSAFRVIQGEGSLLYPVRETQFSLLAPLQVFGIDILLGPTVTAQKFMPTHVSMVKMSNLSYGVEQRLRFASFFAQQLALYARVRLHVSSLGAADVAVRDRYSWLTAHYHFATPGTHYALGGEFQSHPGLTWTAYLGYGVETFKLENGSVEYTSYRRGYKFYQKSQGARQFAGKHNFDYDSLSVDFGVRVALSS
ncbi:MAG: hypothetical protein OXT67_10240 [Zetaproteobacteria bacterium]|nr:hypothetical protein [Zetaproteobacteria bacterium]